jgi:hypothetical protein
MRALTILLLAVVAVLVRSAPTHACATAPPRGEEVRVAQEEAIIIWDADTRTEHFIRRAGFTSSADRFGFLVPTPSVPELGEVSVHVFGTLAYEIRPETHVVYEGTDYSLDCLLLASRSGTDAAPGGGPEVKVVSIASVAGYDASVLQANDAGALAQWLGEHGFEATPELEAWLEPYVRNKWSVTAFEVAARPSGDAKTAGSAVVRMSFETTRPFYPYREPAGQQAPPTGKLATLAPATRLLRIFFIGDARVDAKLGAEPWSAEMLYAAPFDAIPQDIAEYIGEHRHLTVFHDETYPRRGVDEVWFDTAADQSEVRPAPVITKMRREDLIPLEPIVLALVVGLVIWRLRRRRRRATAA